MNHKHILVFMLLLVSAAFAQTNPVPRSLPYWEDFANLPWSYTTYPDGFGGWLLGNPSGQFSTAPATLDRVLYANRNASTTTAGVANYNGKIGFLNSNINDLSLVFAVNTQGFQNITLSYQFMTIRNPYNSPYHTRINEAIMQYRVGESGDFTNLYGTEYSNNTDRYVNTGYPHPRNPVNYSLQLPPECDDQPVVQLRTASRRVSGDGSDPSFAIDNISVTGEKLQSTPVELSSFTVGTSAQNKVLLNWITRSETGLRGFYILRAQEPVLDEACLISPLITAANSSEGQSYSTFTPIPSIQALSSPTPCERRERLAFPSTTYGGSCYAGLNPAANPPARIRLSGMAKTSLAKVAPAASTESAWTRCREAIHAGWCWPNELPHLLLQTQVLFIT